MSSRTTANPMAMRALEVAEEKVGLRELTERLNAPSATVHAWRDGEATMPQHRFLVLLDLLTALDPGWYDVSR